MVPVQPRTWWHSVALQGTGRAGGTRVFTSPRRPRRDCQAQGRRFDPGHPLSGSRTAGWLDRLRTLGCHPGQRPRVKPITPPGAERVPDGPRHHSLGSMIERLGFDGPRLEDCAHRPAENPQSTKEPALDQQPTTAHLIGSREVSWLQLSALSRSKNRSQG